MTAGVGSSEAAPSAEKKEDSPPRGPAGRGRGTTMPSWMTKGVSDAPPPSIPDQPKEQPKGKKEPEPNILDSIFEERDTTNVASGGWDSRKRRRGGGRDEDKGGKWDKKDDWKDKKDDWKSSDWKGGSWSSWNKDSWDKDKWDNKDR